MSRPSKDRSPSGGEENPDSSDQAVRKYEKGERRHKHVGRKPYPYIEFDRHDPKKWVGKCPKQYGDADGERLLAEAIAGPNGDREISYPKKLYVIDLGTIYEAQTTTRGRSYHGYPYMGSLGARLLEELAKMADKKDCRREFDDWVKKYIRVSGR